MTEDVKPEVKPEVKEESKNTIAVDLDGISINVDLETGKKIIEARQKSKKDFKDLQDKIIKAESQAKQEGDRAKLLEAMKASDIDSVRAQVSQEYLGKISTYESKIFNGEIKSQLATLGVLPEALDDAVSLALTGIKPELVGNDIKLGDKNAKEYLVDWIKTRPHLVAVKQVAGKVVKGATPPVTQTKPSLNAGMAEFLKEKMIYSDYIAAGGVTMVYPGEELGTPPEGYFWREVWFGANLICYKLSEVIKKSDCGCN